MPALAKGRRSCRSRVGAYGVNVAGAGPDYRRSGALSWADRGRLTDSLGFTVAWLVPIEAHGDSSTCRDDDLSGRRRCIRGGLGVGHRSTSGAGWIVRLGGVGRGRGDRAGAAGSGSRADVVGCSDMVWNACRWARLSRGLGRRHRGDRRRQFLHGWRGTARIAGARSRSRRCRDRCRALGRSASVAAFSSCGRPEVTTGPPRPRRAERCHRAGVMDGVGHEMGGATRQRGH